MAFYEVTWKTKERLAPKETWKVKTERKDLPFSVICATLPMAEKFKKFLEKDKSIREIKITPK